MEKTIDLTKEVLDWFKQNMDKFPEDELRKIQENPEIIVDTVLQTFKQECEKQGIDYKQTAMYQCELKYREGK